MNLHSNLYSQDSEKRRTDWLQPECWIGESDTLQMMRSNLALYINTCLPVLIEGGVGTGKIIAAYDIHQGDGNCHPFLVSDCQHWEAKDRIDIIKNLWQQARGGSLFLRNIDALDGACADVIKEYWLKSEAKKTVKERPEDRVRLMAGTRAESVRQGLAYENNSLLDWLRYHSLTIQLKKLKERKGDIRDLVQYFSTTNEKISSLSLMSSAWQVLENYSWPGNVKQLKRCLEKVAILEPGSVVSGGTLLRIFPSMLVDSHMSILPEKSLSISRSQRGGKNVIVFEDARMGLESSNGMTSDIKIKQISANTLLELQKPEASYHPALDKAISFICHNYKNAFSMQDLARHACISPSHLSFLFKQHLGQSFKKILLTLRIEEAIKLLNDNPNRQVTLICNDVGFSDLSFFERKFKKTVGVSPGVYRDKYRKNIG